MILTTAFRKKSSLRLGRLSTISRSQLVALAVSASSICSASQDKPANPANFAAVNSSLYLKVRLEKFTKLSKLKAGGFVEGILERDVYSADRELFTSGSHVRLQVDHMEKRRRERNDHWPWVIQAFTPRHELYPLFTKATVSGNNAESTLYVSTLSVGRMREIHARDKTAGRQTRKTALQSGRP